MSTRQIRIEGERMNPERIPVGTRGSYAMVNLSFSFDAEWSGLTKKIVFYPQRGEPVYRVYTAGEAVVPAEVMQYAGESPFVVSGYETDGEGTLLRKVISCPGILIVEHTLSDVGHEPEIPSASAFENIVEKLGAPYIGDNGNWFVWDAESNSFMDTGLPSRGIQGEVGRGLTILGHYDTLDALKAAVSAPQDGDAYSVGTVLPYPVYIWDGALGEWVDHGNLRGVGIQKIEQISSSMDSLGANVIRVTLDDGSFYDYTVRNGDRGPAGSLWIGTSEPPDDSYSIWLNPSGMVSGYVGANQGAENAGRVLAVGADGVVIPREETPYTLPEASPDALGGIKADAAETADTQPVRKGTDGKLYTAQGVGTSIGITGASAGQIPKVKAVDESGAPTEWTAEKDTTPFIVTLGGDEYSGYTSSNTFDEIAAAASAGRVVMAYTDYIDFPQVGQSLYGVYFDLDSTQDVAIFVYIDPWNMIKYTFSVDPSSISASASYLSATSSTFGGVKADAAETADTQPVRIGEDGKLYTAPGSGGADISLGISGATAGQMAKVKAVDASGAPTEWEAGDAASGGDGWTEIGELTVGGTKFIISDYTDGVITVTPDNGIYPSVGSRAYVIRKPDYSAYINARLVATQTEGKFTLVNLDNAVYTPSEDLTQYVIDATDAWGELAFSNLPSFSYFKIRITTPLLSSHGSRSTIEIIGKIQFTIGPSCSNLTGGAVEMVVETDESPVSGKDYVKASFKGKKPDRSNGYDVIDFVSKSTSDSIKIKHYSGLMVSGTNVKLWGRN